jgi:hypothetical protein
MSIHFRDGRYRGVRFNRQPSLRCRWLNGKMNASAPWPTTLFLLDAPADIRQRAEQAATDWQGWITWHPDGAMVRAGICLQRPMQ